MEWGKEIGERERGEGEGVGEGRRIEKWERWG